MTEHTTTAAGTASRIGGAFATAQADGRIVLAPFVTVGYPTLERSKKLVRAIAEAGADMMEIGIPFSDPLADGATVQRTSQRALEQGVTLTDAFRMIEELRAEGMTIPIVFMGYANPFWQYGLEKLAARAADVGVDGFIVPDLPAEEADEWVKAFRAAGRDLIFLVAPTSTDQRLQRVAEQASGFIYCVSLTGVTGARESLAGDLADYIGRVRAKTDLPLAIGFGISTPEHVAEVATIADGAIIASALINYLDTLPEADEEAGAKEFVGKLRAATAKQG
jgi:tryptophan synthase alpha chain